MISRRAALAMYCGWMASLGLAYFTLVPAQPVIAAVIGFSAAAAIVAGVWQNRPTRTGAWLLLAAAVTASTVGWAVYMALPGADGTMKQGMFLVDLFAVAKFALVLAGLVGLARRHRAGVDWAAVIDATILVLGVGLLVWVLLVVPLGATAATQQIGELIATGYPLGDALLLVATALFVTTVRHTVSAAMVAVSMMAMVVSEIVLLAGHLAGLWLRGTPADLWWMTSFGILGATALHRSMVTVGPDPAIQSYGASTARLVQLALASLIPPAILLLETLRRAMLHGSWIVITTAAMALLVLARLTGAAYRLRRQSTREYCLRQATAELVAATDEHDVAAALEAAVRRLLPAGAPYRLVLAAGETRLDGADGRGITRPGVVDPATLPDTVSVRLNHAHRALVYPLLKEGSDADCQAGLVVVGADDGALATLRVPLATLAAAATLALERVRLSQKVIQSASEQYFRALVQNAADVILVLDDDDRIRYASPSAASMFGERELRGLQLPELVEGEAMRATEPAGSPAERSGCAVWTGRGATWMARDSAGRAAVLDVSCRDLRHDPSIRGRVMTLRDITEQRRLEGELTRQAFHDPLTGLPNRLLFARGVQEAVADGVAAGTVTGVLLIDLDEFKLVNDALGHEAGDEYLAAVGRRLHDVTAPHGLAARLGGDEFAALITNEPDAAAVDGIAARLVDAMEQPVRLNGQTVACGASIGVSTTADSISAQELMRQADLSLYAAKQGGKSHWRHYQPAMRQAVERRLELRSSLEDALREDALAIEYQPIVRLADADIVGYEALLRWDHPGRGRLTPAEFLDVAEESGLIVPIGGWMLSTAVQAAASWRSTVPEQPRYVSVNVSARQFQASGFTEQIRRALAAANLPAAELMLEITESLLLRDDERVWRELHRLRNMGVRLAIDDFGTGYSALSYLRQIPLDVIKIDRRFAVSIPSPRQQRSILEGVVNLAHALDLAVVAEGIETPAERVNATEAGCAYGQGYLFARPMPAAEVLRGLAGGSRAAGGDWRTIKS